MYRIFGPKFWITAISYVVLATNFAFGLLDEYLPEVGVEPSFGKVVFWVQVVVAIFFVTPTWRLFWKAFPKMNDWVFPDLNGEWDVEVSSNWPRIDRLLKSASGKESPIDFRVCDGAELPPLTPLKMRARITQTWGHIHIHLWNPNQDTPIKDSDTFLVEPIRGAENTRPAMSYMFSQRNETDVVSDDPMFHGAARLEIQPGHNVMEGTMWSNRMWRRGMNTAASLRFIRAT